MASRDLIVHIVGDDSSLQRAYKQSTAATVQFDRKMSQTFRTTKAGSSVFRDLGRTLPVAGAAFIAVAEISDVLKDSIAEASEAAVVQRQLAAQFKASGQNLQQYQQRIDETTTRLSLMAGIQDEELTRSFITAFRGTRDVTTGLKIQAIAADVARGRNIDLSTATIALTKAFLGQTTAIRRLGINIPATAHGMEVLNFAQAKFAGQAKAAATPQERFNVAIKETKETIGTALLPVFNNLLTSLTDWLGKAENQKELQTDIEAVVRTSAAAFGLLADAVTATADAYNSFPSWARNKGLADLIPGGNISGRDLWNKLFGGGGGGGGLGPSSVPFRPARLTEGVTAAVLAGTTGKQRASLAFQMSMLQEQLAKAELTAGTRDERAILVRTQNLIRRRIAVTRDLKARTELYQSLGSVESQIAGIDAKIAADKQDAADKEKTAKRKQLEAEKQRLENHREHIRKVRAAWQEQLQTLRDAADRVRGEFGGLPFQQTPEGILGVTGQSTGGFVGAYKAQTRAFVRFYQDLARLSRMGAPRGLLDQIRSELGVGGAGLVRGLVTHPAQLRSLISSYRAREQVVQQVAKADVNIRYANVHIVGSRQGATPATQRRGRQAGVPTSIGSYIG